MFCDEVLSHLRDNHTKNDILASHRFCLSQAFSEKINDFINKQQDYITIKDFVRLPYEKIWIEEKFNNISHGMLVKKAHKSIVPNYHELDFENEHFLQVLYFTQDGNTLLFGFLPETININNYGNAEFRFLVEENNQHIANGILTICGFIYCFLAIINSKGITEITDVNNLGKINRKRLLKDKLPLQSYHLVNLSREIRESISNEKKQIDSHNRLHWRRGHFKARKTGIFWWNAHIAGSKDLGFIEKDYVA